MGMLEGVPKTVLYVSVIFGVIDLVGVIVSADFETVDLLEVFPQKHMFFNWA